MYQKTHEGGRIVEFEIRKKNPARNANGIETWKLMVIEPAIKKFAGNFVLTGIEEITVAA